MGDYLIICNSLDIASKLWEKFYHKMLETGELKKASKFGFTVDTIDNERYFFRSIRREEFLRGFRGEKISGIIFEKMIDQYEKPAFATRGKLLDLHK